MVKGAALITSEDATPVLSQEHMPALFSIRSVKKTVTLSCILHITALRAVCNRRCTISLHVYDISLTCSHQFPRLLPTKGTFLATLLQG
jgi:hypothetical protein